MGKRKYCKGLMVINEDGTSEIVISTCNSFPGMLLVLFHELVHLALYRFIGNLAIRNLIDDGVHRYLRFEGSIIKINKIARSTPECIDVSQSTHKRLNKSRSSMYLGILREPAPNWINKLRYELFR